MANIPESVFQKLDQMSPEGRQRYLETGDPIIKGTIQTAYDSWKAKDPVIEGIAETRKQNPVSMPEAGARNMVEGVTYGHEAELEGVAKASGLNLGEFLVKLAGGPVNAATYVGGQIGKTLGDKGLSGATESYRRERNQAEDRNEQADEEWPNLSTAMELGGNIATGAIAPVAAGAALKGLPLAAGALSAMPLGALYGSGKSKADLTKGEFGEYIGDVADETKTAAIFGGAAGGAGTFLGTQLSKAPRLYNKAKTGLRNMASKRAFKAAHPRLKDYSLLGDTLEAADNRAMEIGGEMLDEGVVGRGRDVFLGASPEKISKRLVEVRQRVSKELEDVIDSLDAKAKASGIELGPDDLVEYLNKNVRQHYTKTNAAADELDVFDDIVAKLRGQKGDREMLNAAQNELAGLNKGVDDLADAGFGIDDLDSPALSQDVVSKQAARSARKDQLRGTIDEIKGQIAKEKPQTFKQSVLERSQLQRNANYDSQGSGATNRVRKDAAKGARKRVEETADEIDSMDGAAYKRLNSKYNKLTEADEMAMDAANRGEANQTLGLRDSVAGTAGYMAGGYPGSLAGLGISKIMRTRGNAQAATILNNLHKVTEAGDPFVRGVANLLLNNPDKLGDWSNKLINAAQRSNTEFIQMAQLMASEDQGMRKVVKSNVRKERQKHR
jgi:hypothetical protein